MLENIWYLKVTLEEQAPVAELIRKVTTYQSGDGQFVKVYYAKGP